MKGRERRQVVRKQRSLVLACPKCQAPAGEFCRSADLPGAPGLRLGGGSHTHAARKRAIAEGAG